MSRHVLKLRSQALLSEGIKSWKHSYNTAQLKKDSLLSSASDAVESFMNRNPQHKSRITSGPFKAKYHEHSCIIIETEEHQFALIQTEMFYI